MLMLLFECANGFYYKFPENHCAFCKNCNHILYDYTHGPYMFTCDLGHESYEKCDVFSYDNSGYIIENNTIKKYKNIRGVESYD